MLCHSFKGCALPPSLLFHALFLSPIQTHKVASTIFWRDNQKITGLGREILYNIQPLILPSTGHTGDLGDAQTLVRGSQEVITPRPAQGPNSQEAVMPRPAQEFDLWEAVTSQPAWGSAP